ncbi:LLM class flavin-dependent oxidoreductase [Streptomyces sp. NPDC102405]|uniref:LLM class flavin-dependent oxidoreductase n=1 Tax=Streptomyces sp. NPDC102405 TaxID=3366170 RepID=UPI0038007C9B
MFGSIALHPDEQFLAQRHRGPVHRPAHCRHPWPPPGLEGAASQAADQFQFPLPATAADVEKAPVAQEIFNASPCPVRRQRRPTALPVGRSSEQALLIDGLGLDLLTIQDHPYQAAFDDTWTLLTFLAARTRHVTLVPTVSSLPLRPPAVLAKAVTTLDRLTGSRVQLGLGADALWEAVEAMGGSRRMPREAVDALEEAITVIRAMWSGERSVRTHGAHYTLSFETLTRAGVEAAPQELRFLPGLKAWVSTNDRSDETGASRPTPQRSPTAYLSTQVRVRGGVLAGAAGCPSS